MVDLAQWNILRAILCLHIFLKIARNAFVTQNGSGGVLCADQIAALLVVLAELLQQHLGMCAVAA